MKRQRKQKEPLHNTPDFMASELEDVKGSFHQVKIALRTRKCNPAKLGCPVSLHR